MLCTAGADSAFERPALPAATRQLRHVGYDQELHPAAVWVVEAVKAVQALILTAEIKLGKSPVERFWRQIDHVWWTSARDRLDGSRASQGAAPTMRTYNYVLALPAGSGSMGMLSSESAASA